MTGVPGPTGPPGPRGRSGEMGPAVSLTVLLFICSVLFSKLGLFLALEPVKQVTLLQSKLRSCSSRTL